MSQSIIQTRKECYICRLKYNVMTTTGLEEHHVFNGPLRKKAEYYGRKMLRYFLGFLTGGTKMKTKRLKKLMMSRGLSRNQANSIVAAQRAEGSKEVSNHLYWIIFRDHIRYHEREPLLHLNAFILR